jgi:hypothetical protein
MKVKEVALYTKCMAWFINIYVGWVLALKKIPLNMVTSHELRPALTINRNMNPKILEWFQDLLKNSMMISEAKSERGTVTVFTPEKKPEIMGTVPTLPGNGMQCP